MLAVVRIIFDFFAIFKILDIDNSGNHATLDIITEM
jgi:hypothetical protein